MVYSFFRACTLDGLLPGFHLTILDTCAQGIVNPDGQPIVKYTVLLYNWNAQLVECGLRRQAVMRPFFFLYGNRSIFY